MEEVLAIIKEWWDEIQGGKQLRRFRSGVIQRLSARGVLEKGDSSASGSGGNLAVPTSDDDLLDAIVDLVDLEKKVTMSRVFQKEADRFLEAKPELFLSRVVQHFRYLFGVKTIEGIFPKLNEVYLYVSEMENFTRVLGAMVGQNQKISTSALLAIVQSALRRGSKKEEGKDGSIALKQRGFEEEEGKEFMAS